MKAYRIQLSATLKGNTWCNGVQFDNEGLSLGPVSQDKIDIFAGQDTRNYSLVQYRDEDDVKRITELILQLNESGKKVRELEAQLEAAQQAGDAGKATKKH